MREISYIEAAREALADEMKRDSTIFVVGEGIGERGGNFNTTAGLFELYGPQRLRDTPISERGFSTMCIGAAIAGARPVVDFMFADFALDAFSDLVNQASRMRWMSSGRISVPMVIRGCIGIYRYGSAHHSGSHYSFFAHQPGFHVVLPSGPRNAKGLLTTALRSDDPVVFLEHRALLALKEDVPEGEYTIPFGLAEVVRQGSEITIVAISAMVPASLEAAAVLEGEGVSVEIIDPRTVAPLDVETIKESVHKTGRLLVVEEDYAPCSVAAEIAARVGDEAFNDLDAPIRRLHCGFAPAPYSPVLEKEIVISVDAIVQAVRDLRAE
jgi:2-oxoisovalerate dehydrogenase E1 component